MKKILFFVCAIFLLSSCHMFNGHTTVVNNSSYTVSFEWGGRTETLEPNDSAYIEYTYVMIQNLQPKKRVKINYIDDNNRDITDIPSYEVYVENLTPEPITLRADGWLENDMVNIITGYFINDSSQRGLIYTKKPTFTIEGNLFSIVIIDYEFIDDICYVKIY